MLTKEQIGFSRANGYLLLPGLWLDLCARVREAMWDSLLRIQKCVRTTRIPIWGLFEVAKC